MNKTLKLINTLIGRKNPGVYPNMSYATYFSEITCISNSIIDESSDTKLRDIKILLEIHKLPESSVKYKLLELIKGND